MRRSLLYLDDLVQARPYNKELPIELKPYHVYLSYCGHCIMCVLKCEIEPGMTGVPGELDDVELSLPVKYMLEKDYSILGDYIVVDAPYDDNLVPYMELEYDEF